MYMLLPAMQGADAPMLVQAIQEMKDRYKEPQLGHHLIRFRTILRRSKTISEEDKQEVEDKLHTYDSLLDQDPYIQEQKALERTLGRTEGRIESIKTFQDTIVEIVKIRFPTLTELAQKKVMQLQNLADLKQLVVQLSISSDQVAAQQLLMSIG
jgi:two-component sensor histidine kinase